MMFLDDCAQVFQPEGSCRPQPTSSSVCPRGQMDASSSSCQKPAEACAHTSEEEEEKKFNLGLLKMVVRAESNRVEEEKKKRHGHHHH